MERSLLAIVANSFSYLRQSKYALASSLARCCTWGSSIVGRLAQTFMILRKWYLTAHVGSSISVLKVRWRFLLSAILIRDTIEDGLTDNSLFNGMYA